MGGGSAYIGGGSTYIGDGSTYIGGGSMYIGGCLLSSSGGFRLGYGRFGCISSVSLQVGDPGGVLGEGTKMGLSESPLYSGECLPGGRNP